MDDDIKQIRRDRWLQFQQPSSTQNDSTIASSSINYKPTIQSRPYSHLKSSPIEIKSSSSSSIQSHPVVDLTVSSSDDDEPSKSISFTICTYNIWFGPPFQSERMSAILSTILPHKPLLIGMQELTPLLQSYLSPTLLLNQYKIYPQHIPLDSYGVGLAIHKNANIIEQGWMPYNTTIMARGLLWVHIRYQTYGILFATTHLESYMRSETGAPQRASQIQQAEQFLISYSMKHSIDIIILTGDLNWDDERKNGRKGHDSNLLSLLTTSPLWTDAWKHKYPNHFGYTYDSKLNPMLSGNLQRRFDRCLVYHPTNTLSIQDVKMVGEKIIPGIEWKKDITHWKGGSSTRFKKYKNFPVLPSDHYGLCVKFGNENSAETRTR